ncbi:WhiB family transcriptional regulator [Kitasatospora sp. NBC_01539]|uniref:WhiB family transcriptional regulator n=1 Tax=Kitasatospora sp. NBC_01539 TaxID=2903577 RepID=UPI0038601E82
MSTVITPPLPSVPTDTFTQADPAAPPEVTLMQQLNSFDEADALGQTVPCRAFDPEVFFAETPADVEYAKSLCGTCPVKESCLAGALDRREPWGVWGGELFVQGVIVARKRPRGRPRKTEVMA